MGLSFRKSFKIAPGVRMNVSSRGVGASFGGKGLRYSVNSRGQRRMTASIPGTGISYSTSSSGSKKSYKSSAYQRQRELDRIQKEREKLQEIERNRLEVDLFQNRLDMIRSIHKECDEEVNWTDIQHTKPPYAKENPGPEEGAALEKIKKYQPGFFARLLKQEEKKMEFLRKEVLEARKRDEETYTAWEHMVETAKRIVDGDIDAYFEIIADFAPLDDLSEFGSGFEFFAEDASSMEVEFDVRSKSVVPAEIKSLTSTGKLSVKKMPVSQFYDIQQDYVASCVIRIARDLFALLPVDSVLIHAMDQQFNTVTGYEEEMVILSVRIYRNTLNLLNFNAIDPSDALANFEYRMNFRKTKGFAPVDKIVMI
ncbi:DUF4236 domain-containing protein [Neobacillus sp. NRS-1170]|uniref:DUF4236 domain-containing protein n=1 Tax=Neobacillus sp. NRS-1170 TaxID=3233898 RepID=UPI003D2B598C